MAYKYKHFIPQNTAPSGSTSIGVYDGDDKQICTIPLGRMTPPSKTPLYSFGLVSDIHLGRTNISAYGYSWDKFDNTLSYFKSIGCTFCLVCGDLTVTGLYYSPDDTVANAVLEETQFAKYKEICEKYDIPVYELMGNHESYYSKPISNNLALMTTYTGNGTLSYTMEQGNDLFILCGQDHGSSVMSAEDFAWLGETLEANKNRRCFVFVHPYIEEDSGDPLDVRENSMFENKYGGAVKRDAFINLLKQYPNAILFHGHSHMKFELQEFDVNANYTERNGFKSVHIPSLAVPRDINFDTMASQDDRNASQGYTVDVYDDFIVLNGMDFVNNTPVPLGTYKINTD